ncbi:hypothetical protein [Actinomadura coerulea]|uniref:hypothetical protein n=1 Tax=Actinomadura coerulea TaxID=46159 RepID=UPI00341A6782
MTVPTSITAGRPESRRLAALYAAPGPPSEDALREMARLVEAAGGRDRAAAEADRRVAAAGRHLRDSGMDGAVAAGFRDIALFVTSRDH